MKLKIVKIEITFTGGDKLTTKPPKVRASIGDVLQWSIRNGDATIRFRPNETPFATATVRSGFQYMVLRSGTFSYRCTLKQKSGKVIAWPDEGGGEVVIETRGT
jgi:hypothetical protein